MSEQAPPRTPRAFAPDDPGVARQLSEQQPGASADDGAQQADDEADDGVAPAVARRGAIAWGSIFLSAFAGLAVMAASLSFARFISTAFARDDWIGWVATTLLVVGLAAGAVIVGRELVGIARLRRLAGIRQAADRALADRDHQSELGVARRLDGLLAGRRELAWALARFREHQRDVLDPGSLLALADRDLMVPLDTQARRLVMKSAKRVATVTAISPMALIAVAFVAIENLRMMRALAGLYGGRPGLIGSLRLFKLVIAHLIATGGIALTDDLLGQFIGQDVLRRLSRRLGEGVFNGALTARLGTAAVEVCRPLPFIEATPIRARDFVAELFRKDNPRSLRPQL